MNITDYICESIDKNIAIVVHENIYIRMTEIIWEKLSSKGLKPHRFNISNIWLDEINVNIHVLRQNYISDLRGKTIHSIFIHNIFNNTDKAAILYHMVGYRSTGDFFIKYFDF